MGRQHRRGLTTTIGALACVGVLALAACSGAADESSGGDAAVESGGARSAPEAAPETADSGGGRSSDAGTVSALSALAAERAVVREGSIGLRDKDVDGARARVVELVTAAGGYVGDERTSTDDGRTTQTALTLVVPTDRFAQVLDELGEVATVVSRRQSAQDVTEQVVDVDSRVRSAQASLDRVRTLMSRADKIGDVLQLEGVLAERQAELESLQAQQKSLAERTATASIQVTVTAPPRAAAAGPDERGGFVGGLARGWDALSATWGGLTTAVGVVLPLLLAVGVPVALLAWALRRVVARRRHDRPATPAA